MKKILLLSDTHGTIDSSITKYAHTVDQIWHAGDIGSMDVARKLEEIAPLKAVYGNIDGWEVRASYPERLRFTVEGVDIFMKHIGGYPPRYDRSVIEEIYAAPPRLFISGHSHILKVMMDKERGVMHFNPGAAGCYGFHKVRTMLRFTLSDGQIKDLEAIELGDRGHNNI